jgi:hypothetical protein
MSLFSSNYVIKYRVPVTTNFHDIFRNTISWSYYVPLLILTGPIFLLGSFGLRYSYFTKKSQKRPFFENWEKWSKHRIFLFLYCLLRLKLLKWVDFIEKIFYWSRSASALILFYFKYGWHNIHIPGMEIINFRIIFPYFSKRNGTKKLNLWKKKFHYPSFKHWKKKKIFPDGNLCSVGKKKPFFTDGNFRSVRTEFRILGITYIFLKIYS